MDLQGMEGRAHAPKRPSGLRLFSVAVCVVSALSGGCASKEEAPAPPDPVLPKPVEPTRPKRPPSRPSDDPLPSPPGARPGLPGGGPSHERPETDEDQLGPDTGERPLASVAEVTGGPVSSEVIAGVVREHLESFRPCAIADAKVELRLTLGPAGSVASAEAPRSQPDDPRLRDCVVDVVRALRFPRDPGSDTSVVSFELVLTKPAF